MYLHYSFNHTYEPTQSHVYVTQHFQKQVDNITIIFKTRYYKYYTLYNYYNVRIHNMIVLNRKYLK